MAKKVKVKHVKKIVPIKINYVENYEFESRKQLNRLKNG